MVDTFRGQIRVRKWPRKRGPPKSQVTRDQNTWFKQANDIAKRLEPTQQNLAIEMTKGTGLYPRDLLLRQQAGGIYEVSFEDGFSPVHRRYFRDTIMFQGASLTLTSTQAMPAGLNTKVTWPLPVLDTAGFWNAGAPTRLTIPAGIEVVELACAFVGTNPAGTVEVKNALWINGVEGPRTVTRAGGNPGSTFLRGALPVVEGDYFEMAINPTIAISIFHLGLSYFTLNVLQAT